MNKRIRADFAISHKNNRIIEIGKSLVLVPEIKHVNKGIKWFDDSQLMKMSGSHIIK